MIVVELVPLSRKMPMDTLLYTSGQAHLVGDLAVAPFQDSEITGVIIAIHQIGAIKSHIRSLSYKIRDGVETTIASWIPIDVVRSYITYAQSCKTPLISVFGLLWYEGAPLFDRLQSPSTKPTGVVGSMIERAQCYKQHDVPIVYIITPDVVHARALAYYLPGSVVVTTAKMLGTRLSTRLSNPGSFIPQDDGTVGVLPQVIILPNKLLPYLVPKLPPESTIVFDGVMSDNFTRRGKTGTFFSHAGIYVDMLARLGHQIITGDELLPFGDFTTLWTQTHSYTIPAPTIASEAVRVKHKRYKTLEQYHLKEIIKAVETGKRVLIYCNQRDISGYVVCANCHHIERCEQCQGTLRLKLVDNRHVLECSSCHNQTRARDVCPACDGITLQTRRQGIDGYVKQLREFSGALRIATYTSDTKQAQLVINDWQSRGGVLVTTSVVFSHPDISIDMLYIAPHTWTGSPDTPEEHTYEYLWLAHRSTRVVSIPITREILTQSQDTDTIDILARARTEFESAKSHNLNLPGILI